jgi:mono/diheme cytochrome c family protein
MMRVYSSVFITICVAVACAAVAASQTRNGKPRSAARLYRRYCVNCHGSDGRAKTSKGKFSHARDLTDGEWQDDVTDERLFNSIMNGRNVRGNMPSFSDKINQNEADSLVAFVRRLRG